MPTAAKLFAAFAMAVVAFFTAQVFMPHMEEGTQFGAFVPVSALIGLVSGWRILGRETGGGMWQSANAGMKAAAITAALGLFIFSTEEMIVLAFRRSYDGPLEAVIGILSLALDFVQRMLVPDVLIVLFGGGALAGCLSEWAARRWR